MTEAGQGGPSAVAGKEPAGVNQSMSLQRALVILDFVAGPDIPSTGVSLADIAHGTGLNKSTAYRLLAPLAARHLVVQSSSTKNWNLGPYAAYLGQTYLDRLDLRSAAHEALAGLADSIGETAHLVIFDSPDVVYLDKVETTSSVRMTARIGSRQPAYSSGVGKAFLAHANLDDVESVIRAGMPRKTENTITDPEKFRIELARIRERGYAVDDMENEPQVRCVAAPVFAADGSVCAALSIAGPSNRVTRERVADLANQVLHAAADVTRILGGPPATEAI